MYCWNLIEVLPGFYEIFRSSERSSQHGICILMCNIRSMNNLKLVLLKYKRSMN
jgi:hypothetical protein